MIKLTTDDIALLKSNSTEIPLKDILLLGTEVLSLILHNNKDCLGCFSISTLCGKTKCSNFDGSIKFGEILLDKYKVNVTREKFARNTVNDTIDKVEEKEIINNVKEIKKERKKGTNFDEKMIQEITKDFHLIEKKKAQNRRKKLKEKRNNEKLLKEEKTKNEEKIKKEIENKEKMIEKLNELEKIIKEKAEKLNDPEKENLKDADKQTDWHYWGFPNEKK